MAVLSSQSNLGFESLADACRRQASLGDRPAFVWRDQTISFREFDVRTDKLAATLAARGVRQNDRVALISKDSIDTYAIFFACAKLGAVLVPINWRLASIELSAILSDCRPGLILISQEFVDRFQTVAPISVVCLESIGAAQSDETLINGVRQSLEDPVVQIYTSGTTGQPKGVVLANRTFIQLLREMHTGGDSWMNLNVDDVLLLSLPQFHIGGLWWAIQGFLAGATGIMLESFVGWQALELIQKHRITKVPLVPAMLQFVLSEPDINTADLSSVKAVLYGGSPIAPELLERAMIRFGCDFFQIYGLTETGNMAVCLRPQDHELASRRRTAGRALPSVQISILDTVGNRLPNYEIGEIYLKSPSVMLEYFNRPEETKEVLCDGWIRTGDAGYLDDDGYLCVCDRIKDMIIYAGEKIFPAEVESALLEHESIVDAAVIGVPDLRGGELVKAILVCSSGATTPKTRELLTFLRTRLADFKLPKSFEFVDSLPRNPSGKLLKHVLRAPYWANLDRKVN